MMDSFRRPPHPRRVFFLATCPDPTTLDPSLLQRGRLESVLRLGQLDSTGRASILHIHCRGMPLQLLPQPAVPAVGRGLESDSPKVSVVMKSLLLGRDDDNVDVAQKNASGSAIRQDGAVEAPIFPPGGGRDTSSSLCGEKGVDCVHAAEASTKTAGAEAKKAAAGAVTVVVNTPPPSLPKTREDFLRLVAAKCHGYLGSDLERLCREAAMHHMATAKPAATRTKAVTAASTPGRLPAQEGSAIAITAAATEAGGKHAVGREKQELGLTAGVVREEGGSDGGGVEARVRVQDFWAALDVVRPASLVGHSVGMQRGDGGMEVRGVRALGGAQTGLGCACVCGYPVGGIRGRTKRYYCVKYLFQPGLVFVFRRFLWVGESRSS